MKKAKFLIFHVTFLNKDISIIIRDIILKFCMSFLHIPPEGSVSHFFYLGPRFYFMRFTNNVLKI